MVPKKGMKSVVTSATIIPCFFKTDKFKKKLNSTPSKVQKKTEYHKSRIFKKKQLNSTNRGFSKKKTEFNMKLFRIMRYDLPNKPIGPNFLR